MRIKTSLTMTAAAVIAAGGVLAGIAIGHGGNHSPQLVVRQDAATSSAATSSASASVAAPATTVTRSTVAVKRPATNQENSVTEQTTTPSAPQQLAPMDTSSDANDVVQMTGAPTTEAGGAVRPPQPPLMITSSASAPAPH